MKYSNIPSARTVVHHCKARGIEHIVISPGSRNAPLTLGFTSDPYFKCYSIVDERSAAFFAVGIAQQIQKPVVLLCTSGSALLNYYPAVAEAYYSDIPLVVLSADRPPYKIDIGDGQTIRQDNVFDRHIGYSAHLKQDLTHATDEIRQWTPDAIPENSEELQSYQNRIQSFNDKELNEAFKWVFDHYHPVHINIPFEEPLYGLVDDAVTDTRVVQTKHPAENPIPDIESMKDIWRSSKRKMVIAGVLYPGSIGSELIEELATDPSVVVLTETTSNMPHPQFINSIDSVVAPAELAGNSDELFKSLQPDLIVSIGGLIVSKKVKAFLRRYKSKHHWHIHEKKAYDTFQSLTKHIPTKPKVFFEQILNGTVPTDSAFKKSWLLPDSQQKNLREDYLQDLPFSDMKAFEIILKAIPKNYQLQLANSSTIRYTQLFDMDPSISVFCNRGTSGIDGSTSTAVGAAMLPYEPCLLISGDLSFHYDLNGLWNDYIRPDFRIIVMNNGGGGIFRILPGKKEDANFERFFETTHHMKIDKICAAFDLEHAIAKDQLSLHRMLGEFFKPGSGPKLLEVQTPRKINDKVLLDYFKHLSLKIYS